MRIYIKWKLDFNLISFAKKKYLYKKRKKTQKCRFLSIINYILDLKGIIKFFDP